MKQIIRLFILIAALVLGTDHAWADAESNPRVKFVYVNEQHGSAFASAVDSETGLVTITVTINEGEDYRCKAGDLTAEQSINSSLGEARRRSPGDVEGPGKGVPVAVNYVETNKFTLALPADETMNVTVYVGFRAKKALTVTANDHSIYYGCTAADNGVEYSDDFEGEDDESVLEGDLTYTFTNDNGDFGTDNNGPGEFVITPSGLTSPDYAITFVPGTLTVLPVTVKVSVVDPADGEELAGATVQVKDSDGNIVEEWISTTENHVIEGLKTGVTYALCETVAPDGYLISTDNNFFIDEDGTIAFVGSTTTDDEGNTVLLVENSKTKVLVSVVDAADGEALADATVQIIDSNGDIVKEWVSSADDTATSDVNESLHVIEGLKTGEQYTLRETIAPEGYVITTDNTFTIDEEGGITSPCAISEDGALLVENSKTKVVVSVVDIADGEVLAGATVQVKDSDGNIVEEWISTADDTDTEDVNESLYVIEGLKTGEEYTLRETVAPEGYVLPTDYTFTIDETGGVTSTGSKTTDDEGNTVLLVENSKTMVKVSVVDPADGEELAGATVQVLDSEGNLVEEWLSTKENHGIEGLKTGEQYTLRETIAPEGYVLSTDFTFTIGEDGEISSTGTLIDNTVLLVENSKTKVVVSVVDIADGEVLAGATVQVLDSEEKLVEEWLSTTENHVIEGLKTGEEYTLHETSVPDGYLISSDNTFTIATDGTITFSGSKTTDDEGNTVLLVKNIMLTSATLKIVWDDNNNQDGKRPTEMTATLSDVSEVTLNSTNSWTATVENLPMYNDDGDEISYEWTQETPDGYVMTDMSTEDGVTTTVTLTLVPVYEITEADGITDAINEALMGKTVNIAFSRTFEALSSGEGKASTVCLPFDLDKPSKTAVGTFYTFGGVSDATGEYVVTMTEETATMLSAGTPYMFKPATTEAISFQNTAYTVPGTGFTAAGTAKDDNDWEFIGTYEEKTWPKEQTETRLYGFAASNFEKSDGTLLNEVGAFRRFNYGHINPFRCYLMAPESLGARGMSKAGNQLPESMKVVLISADGTTTAIGTLDMRTGEVTFGDNWYDLNGRRLNGKPTQKGVYIHNGNKVAIK